MRSILSAAVLISVCGLARDAAAQPGSFSFAMPVMGRVVNDGSFEEEDSGASFDESMMPMGRSGSGDKPLVFKTELGKRLQRLDLTRNPQTILAARVTLAAEKRERRLIEAGVLPDPDAPKPGEKDAKDDKTGASKASGRETPAGAGGVPTVVPGDGVEPPADEPDLIFGPPATPSTPGGAAVPGGINLPANVQLPEAVMARLRALSGGGGEPAMGGEGAGGDEGGDEMGEGGPMMPGMGGMDGPGGGPGGRAMTPEQRQAKAAAAKKLAKKAEQFRLAVVAGDWAGVREFIATEGGEDKEAIYAHVLNSLVAMDQAITPDEILEVSTLGPGELNEKLITKLGLLLKATAQRGSQASAVAAEIKRGTAHFGGVDPGKRKNAATLLVAAGLPIQAQEYLPALEIARESKDPELLNLYAVYFDALSKTKQGKEREEAVEQGWKVTMEVMRLEKATTDQRGAALSRAMGFIADVPGPDGEVFLKQIFEQEPDLGWKAVDEVSKQSRTLRQRNAKADERLRALLAARRLGEAVLSLGPDKAASWRTGMNLLTMLILEEAEATKRGAMTAGRGGEGEDGAYGGYNPYQPGGGQQNRPQFIAADQLNTALPPAAWLRVIDPGLAARLELMVAGTSAASGESEGVLAMIRPIVAVDRERAQKLGDSIIASWPQYARKGTTPFGGGGRMGMYRGYGGYGYNPYGYGGYDGAVPLTRARQERTLGQLKDTLSELASVGLTKFSAPQLVDAFASSHSDAEAYTRADIEAVFGKLDAMNADVRSTLATNMRQRLAGAWRQPQVQQQAGTKRTDKQLSEMVRTGYATAIALAQAWGTADEKSWEAKQTLGDLHYDLSEFLYGQKAETPVYAAERANAFGAYREAAELYSAALAAGTAKPSARVFSQWFSSALGASDLAQLTRQDDEDTAQIQSVVGAIQSLGGETAKKHLGLFAQEITRAMATMNPELKARYVRAAARVFGDSPEGKDARALLSYYDDLTKEIQLSLTLDAGTNVTPGQPFGAQLAVWCTRAVSRESGTFAKYLTNEYYHPMTGQQVSYKDELEKKLRAKLSEKFEIQSITFHKPTVQPMGIERQGWEQYPLAYLVLKVRDASVDRIPRLQMDMDFADGQGQVILPIVSEEVLIDARGQASAPAAFTEVAVEQVLDDRGAVVTSGSPAAGGPGAASEASSPVRLEVRAKAKGLVPALEQVIDTKSLGGATIDRVDDQGLNIADLDTTGESVVPVSERVWIVHLTPNPGESEFRFPSVLDTKAKVALKRYADADIVEAKPTVAMAGTSSGGGAWLMSGAFVVLLLGGSFAWLYARSRRSVGDGPILPRFKVPESLTPFSAVATLRKIETTTDAALSGEQRRELTTVIGELESKYFGPGSVERDVRTAELRTIVQGWVDRAGNGR